MKLYKLTDENGQTYGGTQWGEGIEYSSPGTGELCSSGWIHAYTDPLLAVLFNPIHAQFSHPQLWECEGAGMTKDDRGMKLGVQTLKTLRRIDIPYVSVTQRVAFGILCSLEVCKDIAYVSWANAWLSGKERSREAAGAAAGAA
jgi:enoyl-CoA hydratase/carnithine racemase